MNTDEHGKRPGSRPSVAGARTTRGRGGSQPRARQRAADTAPAAPARASRASDAGRAPASASRRSTPNGRTGAAGQATGGRTRSSQRSRYADYYEPLFDGRGDAAARAAQQRAGFKRIAIGAGVVALAAVAIAFAVMSAPITVTINGAQVEMSPNATVQDAFEKVGSPAAPGNLVDVEGVAIEEGKGHAFSFARNGQPEDDPTVQLAQGDAVTFSDGADIEEESDAQESPILPSSIDEGTGAIHVVESPGTEGVSVTKTGRLSDKTVTQEKEPAQDRVYRRYNPDVGGDKVVALTFDDGPWDTTTAQVLDVLKEHGAKATFFTVGSRIQGDGVELVKREVAEGHQVCTHTWSHASGSGQGVNLSFMSAEEQREEISRGIQAITDAIGSPASTVIRTPGGNFPTTVWDNVGDLIEAEIGWNIDTADWRLPGAGAIAEQIKSAKPGDIILMHDGGGDRTQTVEALRDALPYLKDQGFSFITVDELMEYPPAAE